MDAHMKPSYLLSRAAFLLSLIVLTGCDSVLVDIDSPGAVASGESFEVSVTHAYNDEDSSFITGGGDFNGLVFGVILPAGWTPSPSGTYDGDWDGSEFSVDATLLPSAPRSDMIELLEAASADPTAIAIASALDCENSPPEAPAGSQVAWYAVGPPTPELAHNPGDSGTLTLQIIPTGDDGSYEITFQHALFAINPGNPDEQVCVFYADPNNSTEPVANSISAIIEQLVGAEDSAPIPVLGGGLLALLAALLALTGVMLGRRK